MDISKIEIKDVNFSYKEVKVYKKNLNMCLEKGSIYLIKGKNGSGKSTLLNILAALDKPTEGKVFLKEKDLSKVKEKEMAAFRRNNLGFVFQDFNLLDTFSLKDNIFLPLVPHNKARKSPKQVLPNTYICVGPPHQLHKKQGF